MPDELLTTALCWELNGRIPVEDAYRQRSLHFYCPDKSCLIGVVPARRTNYFFRGEPNAHRSGCRWYKQRNDGAAVVGLPRPEAAAPPPAPAPTYLGAIPRVRRRPTPTPEQVRQLAERADQAPILYSGTLAEVVDAWCAMSAEERSIYPLGMLAGNRTYTSAFRFLRDASTDIARLESETHIVFGKASVTAGDRYFFVNTVKRFDGPNGRLPISIWVPNDDASAESLGQLVGVTATAFWHGEVPTLDRKRTSFFTVAPGRTLYNGLIVKAGEYQP